VKEKIHTNACGFFHGLFCGLIISLELTQETTFLAIDLISAWILRDLTKHRMKNYIKTVAGLRNIITQQYNLETV
jgi:hypothetical protein